jgi:hypothetical protein
MRYQTWRLTRAWRSRPVAGARDRIGARIARAMLARNRRCGADERPPSHWGALCLCPHASPLAQTIIKGRRCLTCAKGLTCPVRSGLHRKGAIFEEFVGRAVEKRGIGPCARLTARIRQMAPIRKRCATAPIRIHLHLQPRRFRGAVTPPMSSQGRAHNPVLEWRPAGCGHRRCRGRATLCPRVRPLRCAPFASR